MPSKPDFSFTGLEEFASELVVMKHVVENSKVKACVDKPKIVRKNNSSPIIKDWVSDSEEENVPPNKNEKKTVKSSFAKIDFVKSKEQVKSPWKTIFKQVWNYTQRVNHQNFYRMTHPSPKRNMVPKAVLMKSGLVSLTTTRPVSTAQPKTTFKNSNFNQRVNTVKDKNVNTTRPKAVLNVVKGNQVNAVKALGNMSYLTNFEEIDEVYVAFGGNPKGGKITATKNETSGILRSFIIGIENLVDHKVKVIRCDNETEFKNKEMNQFCDMKGILRQYSVARTPQQNGVAKRRNRILIEDAKTMLGDSKLPTTFWAEAVNTACYVYPATILNTIDYLGKFDGKADEGFFVGYSLNSKAFRVLNSRTRIVEENLHIRFSKNTPNVVGKVRMETVPGKDYILLPLYTADPPFSQDPKSSHDDEFKPSRDDEKKVDEDPRKDSASKDQEKENNVNSTNNVNVASTNEVNTVGGKTSIELPDDPNMPELEEIVYSDDDEDVGAEADINNLSTFMPVSPIPTTRVHKDHPVEQIIRDLNSAPQTRKMTKNLEEYGRTQKGNSCIEGSKLDRAMQEELLQFKLQEVWTLVELPNGKRAIGYTQEEGIDYDKVFVPVARIEVIRLFLAYASFKDFVVYQIDVKSAFLYGKIEEEVYVYQPPGFEDLNFSDRVYKVEKALYGLHQAPIAWYETLSTYLLDNRFHRGMIDKTLFIKRDKGDIMLVQVYVDDIIFGFIKKSLCTEFEKMTHKKFHMSFMGELTFFLGLQVKQKEDGIFISQGKYVTDILKKFSFFDVKTASTPIETQNPLLKDEDGKEVDVYMYRLMIGSLMYLTASRPDIMYLKGQPKFGLWYPKDSPFDLVAYTDSDYARASLDRKSTIGVAFLSKPAECEGFEQIVDFLNANPIKYALTINPPIYVSCIEQFWSTAKAKTVNKEVQLHALVDGKKVLVTESSVRRDLHLEDAEGVNSLPNATIFEELTRMSAKTTTWNEFSSTMASAIICLATNQKFNFSKYIFENIVKNLDSVGKFLMYPRFIQVFLDNQIEGMETHDEIYIAPSHIKKIFANMRRLRKGFYGRDTPLFPTMMVQAQEETGEANLTIIPPSSSQPQKKQKPRRLNQKDTEAPQPSGPTTNVVAETLNILLLKLEHKDYSSSGDYMVEAESQEAREEGKGRKIDDIDGDEGITLVDETVEDQGSIDEEVMFDVSDLAGEEVVIAEKGVPDVTTTVSTAATIVTHEEITLSQALQELKTVKPKAKGIVFKEPVESTTITPTPIPSKVQDKGKGIMEEPEKPMKKKDQILFDEEITLKLHAQMQAELEEEERLAGEKEEKANIALIES
ncbi:putative ribonuclease H-like domain-containing protein [Tanacetum coccineum]